MNILVVGGDGYIGWPLSLKLKTSYPSANIIIADKLLRRKNVKASGGDSLIPIESIEERIRIANEKLSGNDIKWLNIDVADPEKTQNLFKTYKPEIVYHLGHQPSAPYSMGNLAQTVSTIHNNEISNINILWSIREHCPEAHYIKLGSFGAYAKSGIDIAEGYFKPMYKGKEPHKPMPYPREADDFYHITKINDSNFIGLACRKWNLKVSDVMQSTAFGTATCETLTDKRLATRFDIDPIFGTVLNRFVAMAIAEKPLLVYGSGNQCTGIMGLNDCLKILLHLSKDPAKAGEHRVINNSTYKYSINELASLVERSCKSWGLEPKILRNAHNPRFEEQDKKIDYKIETDYVDAHLEATPIEQTINEALELAMAYKETANKLLVGPNYSW